MARIQHPIYTCQACAAPIHAMDAALFRIPKCSCTDETRPVSEVRRRPEMRNLDLIAQVAADTLAVRGRVRA